jgi:hypothetical protein
MAFMQLRVHKIGVVGRDAAGDIAGSIRERQRSSPSLKPPDQHLGIGRGERTQISTLQWGRGGEKWGLWVKVGDVGEASQNSRARGRPSRPSTLSGGLRAIRRRPSEGRNDNSTSPEGEMLFYVDA